MELPVLVLVAFLVALVIRTLLVQPFFIPSRSMVPTLVEGDRVLVARFLYRLRDPKPGDVLVFRSPNPAELQPVDRGPVGNLFVWLARAFGLRSTERDLIKRVVATGSQVVLIRGGTLRVDDVPVTEPYIAPGSSMSDYGPYRVPEDSVFVMGDNRNESQDSRVFGAVEKSRIVGKAFARIWPPNRLGGL
ncbi:MAG: signal peptidase I [Actinomycetota bacterium]